MGSRVALAVVAAALLCLAGAGCLHADDRAEIRELIVPPIARVDRTVPASDFGRAVQPLPGSFGETCFDITPAGQSRPCSAEAEAELDRATTDGLPRRGAVARVVAELPLRRRGSPAEFVVFPSRQLGACFAVVTSPETQPLGCEATRRCPRICLGWYTGEEDGSSSYLLLAGTVAEAAQALRLSYDDGSERLYALTGPLVPRFPGRRAFMADLRRGGPPARLELLAGDRVVASTTWRAMLSALR